MSRTYRQMHRHSAVVALQRTQARTWKLSNMLALVAAVFYPSPLDPCAPRRVRSGRKVASR